MLPAMKTLILFYLFVTTVKTLYSGQPWRIMSTIVSCPLLRKPLHNGH